MSKKRKTPSKSTFFADFGPPSGLPAAPSQYTKSSAKLEKEKAIFKITDRKVSPGDESLSADAR